MGILIRRANSEELAAVASLQQEFIKEHAELYDQKFYSMAGEAEKEWLSWAMKKMASDELDIFVADSEGSVVGYVSGWVEKRPPIYKLRDTGFLSNIYVTPEHRRKGIASRLNAALLQRFKERGLSHVELSVDSRAEETVSAWIKMGYKEVGKRMRIKL